jgi:hypothetical protein
MSDEEKFAQIGKLMSEHKQAKEDEARLAVECQTLGSKLQHIGQALANHPESVTMQGQGLPMDYQQRGRFDFTAAELDATRILKLTNDYRDALTKKGQLENQLRQLGFPVPAEERGYRG